MDKRRFDNLLVQVAKGSEDAFEKMYDVWSKNYIISKILN